MTNITFEEALERIQQIVSTLEKGEVKLNEATQLFEEGLRLIEFCERQLDHFTQKVQQLRVDSGDDGE